MSSNKRTGTCLCGSVALTFLQDVPGSDKTVMCFCMSCRKAGGSVGSLVYVSPVDEFKVEDGEKTLGTYEDKGTKSGNAAVRYFCKGCGSPIYTTSSADPQTAYVKAGLFAELHQPGTVAFEERRPDWLEVKVGGA